MIKDKINEAFAQERARQAREDAPRSPYDVEPADQYIDGVDFEIDRPYGNRNGKTYVYETAIDGVKIRANVFYSTSTENKTVRFVHYNGDKVPYKTGGYGLGETEYTVRFMPKIAGARAVDIVRMSFSSEANYKRYVNYHLKR